MQKLVLGNSVTANKLATARKIKLIGAIIGEANFDGSGDTTITTKLGNISVLSGSISINPSTSANKTINYPTGFNKDNCIVVSTGLMNSSNTAKGYNFEGTYNDSSDGLNNAYYRRVNAIDEGIKLSITNPNSSSMAILYKITLLKIT